MSLREELTGIIGKRRRFLLLRIAGLDKGVALATVGSSQHAYNGWVGDKKFQPIYRKVNELALEYAQEAVRLIRRDNQLAAAFLEEKIITQLAEELDSGNYKLIKTQLGKEAYKLLIGELDKTPAILHQTWEQRVLALNSREEILLEEGENGYHAISESGEAAQHGAGELGEESESTGESYVEETQKEFTW